VPVAVKVNPALPAATVAGEIAVSVGVTTPLKPPHPLTTVKRTSTLEKQMVRDTFILLFSASPEMFPGFSIERATAKHWGQVI
jgi:hypothetical protein